MAVPIVVRTRQLHMTPVDDRLALSAIAASICKPSNFRFAWRFFKVVRQARRPFPTEQFAARGDSVLTANDACGIIDLWISRQSTPFPTSK